MPGSDVRERIEDILASPPVGPGAGETIGRSREGRPIRAFRFGRGANRVSLLGGCHADEPVGPRFLRHLAACLSALPEEDPLLTGHDWWIVPHINPDGEARNRGWQRDGDAAAYDLAAYLTHVAREPPGDDIEFGFPGDVDDGGARPENLAVYGWWRAAGGPFELHVSLHGMAVGAGPWFLVDSSWRERCELLKERCRRGTRALGYVLHDVDRKGEKGFFRLDPGFSTRPDSRSMREHFLRQGDEETAALFRPSSMETIRRLGGDPLTLVSEMPLFLAPGPGSGGDPEARQAGARGEDWRAMLGRWRASLEEGGDPEAVAAEARRRGVRPMPVRDQMELQWTLVAAGLEQVEAERRRAAFMARSTA